MEEILKVNAWWIIPVAIAFLDAVFHKLPGKYQSIFKKLYDYLKTKLQKK